MFMQKLGTFASTETTLLRKTSSSKRKKMEGKKELHLPLSNLCGKNIHRDKNKYLNKRIKKDNNKPLLLFFVMTTELHKADLH